MLLLLPCLLGEACSAAVETGWFEVKQAKREREIGRRYSFLLPFFFFVWVRGQLATVHSSSRVVAAASAAAAVDRPTREEEEKVPLPARLSCCTSNAT